MSCFLFLWGISSHRKGGLSLKLLGMHANDLARKCDCYNAPILFIFTEVCQSVCDACANITRWEELDSGYVLFLHNDLVELQQKHELLFKNVCDLHEKHCQMEHKIKVSAPSAEATANTVDTACMCAEEHARRSLP